MIIKKHYFCLLFEVYLRKVEGIEISQRLNIFEDKFAKMLEYVVAYDLEQAIDYIECLIIQRNPEETI